MFFRLITVLTVLVAAWAEMDSKLVAQLKNKHLAFKSAKPSHRKVSAKDVQDEIIPSNYLAIHNFDDGSHCGSNPNLVMGLAYDTCIAGDVDPTTGLPLTSVKYYANEAGETFMSYFSEAGDCTGASTENMVSVPTPCINSNMKVTKEPSTEPWGSVNHEGVVMKFFTSPEACAAGGGGYDFMWYSSAFCIPDVAEDFSYMSYKYVACNNDGVTLIYYSDNYCSNELRMETVPPSDCLSTTSNMQPAWISQSCTQYVEPPPEPTVDPTASPTTNPTAV
jgi:hypothetical protein